MILNEEQKAILNGEKGENRQKRREYAEKRKGEWWKKRGCLSKKFSTDFHNSLHREKPQWKGEEKVENYWLDTFLIISFIKPLYASSFSISFSTF